MGRKDRELDERRESREKGGTESAHDTEIQQCLISLVAIYSDCSLIQ